MSAGNGYHIYSFSESESVTCSDPEAIGSDSGGPSPARGRKAAGPPARALPGPPATCSMICSRSHGQPRRPHCTGGPGGGAGMWLPPATYQGPGRLPCRHRAAGASERPSWPSYHRQAGRPAGSNQASGRRGAACRPLSAPRTSARPLSGPKPVGRRDGLPALAQPAIVSSQAQRWGVQTGTHTNKQ